ncbi:MAG: metallophosphoesterase family protein [Candidatus Fermentibacteraceae bacterium]
MPHHEPMTRERLDALLHCRDTPRTSLEESGLAVISDLHMGAGGPADNFRGNEAALMQALAAYREGGRRLVLLGDTEELWQYDMPEIRPHRRPIYSRLRDFGPAGVLRVWGNHDDMWARPDTEDPSGAGPASEAILVETAGRPMLMVHGHQGSLESDLLGGASRLLVRLFRCFEGPWMLLMKALRLYRKPSTMTRIRRDFERVMYRWALDRDTVLVCGHSHRAVFASRSHAERLRAHIRYLRDLLAMVPPQAPEAAEMRLELRGAVRELRHERRRGRDFASVAEGDAAPVYFNSGCGLYREGMTALELDPSGARLVKWGNRRGDREVYHRMPMQHILW